MFGFVFHCCACSIVIAFFLVVFFLSLFVSMLLLGLYCPFCLLFYWSVFLCFFFIPLSFLTFLFSSFFVFVIAFLSFLLFCQVMFLIVCYCYVFYCLLRLCTVLSSVVLSLLVLTSCTVSFATLEKCYCLLLLCLIPLLQFITFRDCVAFHLLFSIISVAFIASFVSIFCLILFYFVSRISRNCDFLFLAMLWWQCRLIGAIIDFKLFRRHSQDNVIFLHTKIC